MQTRHPMQSPIRRALNLALPLVFLLALGASTFACSSENIPKAPMPSGATFTGLWYSNYDDMQLTQKGNEVSGTFEYKDGGRIHGTLEGGVLLFDWVQNGDLSVGRREVRGKGYLVMGKDGMSFKGRWGYEDSRTNGGEWTGDKAAEDYTDDQ